MIFHNHVLIIKYYSKSFHFQHQLESLKLSPLNNKVLHFSFLSYPSIDRYVGHRNTYSNYIEIKCGSCEVIKLLGVVFGSEPNMPCTSEDELFEDARHHCEGKSSCHFRINEFHPAYQCYSYRTTALFSYACQSLYTLQLMESLNDGITFRWF